jgi:hypothetical protein
MKSRRLLAGGIAVAFVIVAVVEASSGFGSGGEVITAFAGLATSANIGDSGDGGPATLATFRGTGGVAVDGQGNVFISDFGNHRVRKVSPDGTISNYAGTGTAGSSGDGGPATSAELDSPLGLTVDGQGNVYLTDVGNNRVRKVSPDGTITLVAGGGTGGLGDGGLATSAQLRSPHGVAVDGLGDVYIADTFDNRVRKVSPGGIITTFAGTGLSGPPTSGNGGPATSANMAPAGVAVDGQGNLYIADYANNLVREVTPGGTINTVAGTGTAGSSGDGGPATSAELNYPMGVAIDGQGNFYIYMNCELREVSGGTITTIADTADTCGNSGDGGLATSAQINGANAGATSALAVDGPGSIYLSDWSNNRIRKIGPGLAAQAITFTSSVPTTAVVGGPTDTVAATGGGSGNPVVFSSAATGVCTVSGSTVRFVGAGTCVIHAAQAGNSNYAAAPTATQSFAVAAGPKKKLCLVPKLKRETLAAARKALKKAHCAVGKVTRHKSSTVPKGRVISSRPKAGTKHRAGTRVALTLSRGKH